MMKKGNKEAVSPVIAVILMVAITVVLAAVLFVMVSELTDDDVGTEMQLGRRTGTHTSDYWVVEIISGSASQEGLTFQLQSGGAAIETVTSTEARWEPDDGAEAAVPGDGEEENNEPIIWLDNDSNSAVNSGDRIRVLRTGRTAGTYQLLVLREGSTIMNIDLTQS